MNDKSIEGLYAEPTEVQAVLQNLCGYHLAEPDAVHRYAVLTREQVLYDALVQAIRRERGRALADLVAAGYTAAQVAELVNLGTRQRVQRLIALAHDADSGATVAARDVEEKLAAVHATLDQLHTLSAG